MGIDQIFLYVFLPVYNRGALTANFLAHLIPLIPECYCLRPVLLDDSCTDNTVNLAKVVCPNLRVIRLSGSDYWGGALNSVKQYICSLNSSDHQKNIYMVCNDDVRFHPMSLVSALSVLGDDLVISPVTILVKDDFRAADSVFADTFQAIRVEPMQVFDPLSGSFKQTVDPSSVNVCETRAMLTRSGPWLACSSIPSDIPHYLSDYWLTYDFFMNGFHIRYPSDFICYNSVTTTRNLASKKKSSSREVSGVLLDLLPAKVRRKLHNCVSSVHKTSPFYAPAWIRFLKTFSNQKHLRWVLLKNYLCYWLGCLLIFLIPSQKCLHSGSE
jgi:hypothetical protein